MFDLYSWIRSLISLFFVIAVVEAFLSPKNRVIKQILSLIILIGVFSPFMRLDAIVWEAQMGIDLPNVQTEGAWAGAAQDPILHHARETIAREVGAFIQEETGEAPQAVDVKTEVDVDNQCRVTEVSVVITEPSDAYNEDKVTNEIKERFGASTVNIKRVGES